MASVFNQYRNIAFISLLLLSFSGLTKTIVITDIDDTLKITHLKNVVGLPGAAIDSEKYFKGMPELLKILKSDGLFYVSNGFNTPFKNVYKKFIRNNKFPNGVLRLRKFNNYKNHKFYNISKIIKTHAPDKVIFIGDNGQEDPNVYHEIEEQFPEVSFLTFIRTLYSQKKGTKLHNGQIGFASPFEIIDRLFERGWIKINTAKSYIEKNALNFLTEGPISKKKDKGKWIPKWVNCKMAALERPEPELLVSLLSIYQKLENRCR